MRLAAGLIGSALVLTCSTVSAQVPPVPTIPPAPPTVTQEQISLAGTLTTLTALAGGRNVGEALSLATAVEVAGAPLGTSAGGFAFKLDKTTGLEARTATTFGPFFSERALTAGAGKMSVSVSLAAATYDNLGDLPLHELQLSSQESADPTLRRQGFISLVMASETTTIQTVMGATDKLDIGVSVPLVRVRLDAISWIQDANGDIRVRAAGAGTSSGLGDIALLGKYRFFRFGGTPPPDAPVEPDPGGFAVYGTARVPTGDKENLRGLGITRVLGGVVFSSGKGRIRPHANIGYEFWSKGVDVRTENNQLVTARNHFSWAAGVELEAAPRLTLLVDFLSRQINGGGKIGFTTTPGTGSVTSTTYPIALPEGTLEQSIVPGLKWNIKAKLLLALNAIINIRDNGLYDKFTPVVGLDWTF